MKRSEIWLVGLDPSQGDEQKGRRPVMIVSPEAHALDLGARGGKRVESIPSAIMDEVLAKLAPIFE